MQANGSAHAFWLRAPGFGEIRPVALPEPGPGRCSRAHACARASAAARRRWCSGAACRRTSTPRCERRSRKATSPDRLSTATSASASSSTGRPSLNGRTVFCLYPHQTSYVVPAEAVSVVPEDVPRPASRARRHRRDRRQRALGRRPLGGRPSRGRRRGDGRLRVARLLSRFPGVEVTLVDVVAGRTEVAARLGVEFAPPDDAAGDRDLVVHTSATSAGLQRSLDLLAPGGLGPRPQLVRRRRGPAVARRRVPLSAAGAPRQPGRHAFAGPKREAHDGRPARARARPAARPGLRRAAHRGVRFRASCPT